MSCSRPATAQLRAALHRRTTAGGTRGLCSRWYQGQTGDFTTRDPAFASTDTAYSYAGDDPVNEDDASGLLQLPIVHWCVGTCKTWSPVPAGWIDDSPTPPAPPFALPSRPAVVGTSVEYQNSNDDLSLLLDWVVGIGTHQYFNQWDPMTQALMNDPHQTAVESEIVGDLQQGGPYTGQDNYVDAATIGDYVRDGGNFLKDQDPDSFLGSYFEYWWAIPLGDCRAQAYFQVSNETDVNSLFGGKVPGANEIRNFLSMTGPLAPFTLGIDPFSMRPQYQEFQWQKTISY